MTRRILSGVFLLVALAVLGVILAGALTSGEQLIVRFLTAIIVAALALYVISDLRLAATDEAAASGSRATTQAPRITTAPADVPPNSTAAFMATVTGRRSRTDDGPISADEFSADAESLLTSDDAGDEQQLGGRRITRRRTPPSVFSSEIDRPAPSKTDYPTGDDGPSPYGADLDEAAAWPFNDTPPTEEPETANPETISASPRSVAVDGGTEIGSPLAEGNGGDDESAEQDLDEIDDLVAMFTRQTEQELEARRRDTGSDDTDSDDAEAAVSALRPAPDTVLAAPPAAETSNFLTPVGAAAVTGDSDDPDLDTPGPMATSDHKAKWQRAESPEWTGLESVTIGDDTATQDGIATGSSATNATREGAIAVADEMTATAEGPASSAGPALDAPPPTGPPRSTTAPEAPSVGRPQSPTPTTPAIDEERPAAPTPSRPDRRVAPLTMRQRPAPVAAADYADEAIAPIIDLRPNPAAAGIDAAIRSGELEVISSLIDQGLLSTDGPVTDRDVRTMVYVAFTSSELRKILLAGGTVDGDNGDLDLGQVEVFADPQPTPFGHSASPRGLPAPRIEAHLPDSQAL